MRLVCRINLPEMFNNKNFDIVCYQLDIYGKLFAGNQKIT